MNLSSNARPITQNEREADDRTALLRWFHAIRDETENLCKPLVTEDYGIQTMPEVSPPKWHLAHATWFFEAFILIPYSENYKPFHPLFDFLFNSYYVTMGTPFPRAQRGLLGRPTVQEVYDYRAHVNKHMESLISVVGKNKWNVIRDRTVLGIHHEQQHQELLLTDIKHIFAANPLRPAYRIAEPISAIAPKLNWIEYAGGMREVGHRGDSFAFDNETPRHRVFLNKFMLASRPATNGEYLQFMEAGGYRDPGLWLSDGWRAVQEHGWRAPLYWENIEGAWWRMTLNGMQRVNVHAPVCHVSFYEADAFARWSGRRLPSEFEWEFAAAELPVSGNLRQAGFLDPQPAPAPVNTPVQLFGDVWEWTQSAYVPYPGFQPLAGSLGEYNGKFMCNQIVLRGGSIATPASHLRATYRNFFYPNDRWQFSGIRLAQ
jgi:ergothioneine biosynthesis protein EgtB